MCMLLFNNTHIWTAWEYLVVDFSFKEYTLAVFNIVFYYFFVFVFLFWKIIFYLRKVFDVNFIQIQKTRKFYIYFLCMFNSLPEKLFVLHSLPLKWLFKFSGLIFCKFFLSFFFPVEFYCKFFLFGCEFFSTFALDKRREYLSLHWRRNAEELYSLVL